MIGPQRTRGPHPHIGSFFFFFYLQLNLIPIYFKTSKPTAQKETLAHLGSLYLNEEKKRKLNCQPLDQMAMRCPDGYKPINKRLLFLFISLSTWQEIFVGNPIQRPPIFDPLVWSVWSHPAHMCWVGDLHSSFSNSSTGKGETNFSETHKFLR